jgi:hypothetical protein
MISRVVITSIGIVTKDCQCTASYHVYCLTCSHHDSNPYLVVLRDSNPKIRSISSLKVPQQEG